MGTRDRAEIEDEIRAGSKEIQALRERVNDLRKELPPEPVDDYVFGTPGGETVRLSELFGDQRELFVIHNMGKRCPMCTMWADGFNGVHDHLAARAAFVVSSPDDPETQQEFAGGRGWRFRMVSTDGTTFAADMGMATEEGVWPGVSAFQQTDDGAVVRVGRSVFGPWDDYNPVFHFFSLLPDGPGDWQPRFSYSA